MPLGITRRFGHRRRVKVLAGFVLSCSVTVVLGCSSGSGAALDARCTANADCASGMCIDTASYESYCTATCTSASDCGSATSDLTCDTVGGACVRRCGTGTTSGSGASTQLCVSGLFVACSTLDAVSHCDTCGCAPYGGGVCIAGMGCVTPEADGSACTLDAQCSSGVCYRDTHTCGAPRGMGGVCHVDAECSTSNCSTDGNTSMAGVCNQRLGSSCTAPTTGNTRTATCTDCLITFGNSSGVCLRDACDPTNAPTCPDFDGHTFECAQSTNGTNHCYETCPDTFHRCFYDTVSCFRAGDFCR